MKRVSPNYEIDFPVMGEKSRVVVKSSDLKNTEGYYFGVDSLPENCVVLEELIDDDELFPEIKLELAAVKSEEVKSLRSFKTKALEGECTFEIYIFGLVDLEELRDGSSVFFFFL